MARGGPVPAEPGLGAVPVKKGNARRSGGRGKRALLCVEVLVPDASCVCQLRVWKLAGEKHSIHTVVSSAGPTES